MQYLPNSLCSSALMQNVFSSVLSSPAKCTGVFSSLGKKLGGKLVLLTLLGVFISFLCSSPIAKGQDCVSGNCGTWTIVPIGTVACKYIIVNGNPCYVCYGYRYRICNGVYQVETTEYKLDPNCQVTMDSTRSNPNFWNILVKSIFAEGDIVCAQDCFKQYVRAGNSNYDCLGSSNCASTVGFSQVQVFNSRCSEFIDIEPTPRVTLKVDCNLLCCCVRSYQMCYDVSTGQVRVCNPTTTIYGGPVTCSGSASYTPPANCNIVHRSGCIEIICE